MTKFVSYGLVIVIILAAVILIGASYLFLFQGEKGTGNTTTTLIINPTTVSGSPTTVSGSSTVPRSTTTILKINEVSVYSDRFDPSQLKIKGNEKVKWINNDTKQHEVVCVDANQNPLFDAILNSGESWEFYPSGSAECWDPSVNEETMRMKIILEV